MKTLPPTKVFSTMAMLLTLSCCSANLLAHRVQALLPDVTVDSVMKAHSNVSKMAFDDLSAHLFYVTYSGDVYEITTNGTDTLRCTANDHGISAVQGLAFMDSSIYLCGNNWGTTTSIGKIVRGQLQANGTYLWSDVVTSHPYPTSSPYGDHGFTGLNIDPSHAFLFVSSGARTHLGEVRSNNGAWPGYREVPMTSRIFRFPINTNNLTLLNDSAWLQSSGYVFAEGTRNAYDMAWDANQNLFAIDNAGERDDPEELNWLRQGHHYGYPWRMGGNDNPLQFANYDVNLDPLVNHQSTGYLNGWFTNDPNFPPPPSGITFTEPIRNYGTTADFYRDALTGQVRNASDEATYITTFTAHRSPLGLVIDSDSILANPYRGDAFVLNFMPGGDSSGFTPLSPWGGPCPFVDTARELVQMKLAYDATIDNFTATTANVVTGFYLPVDAVMVGAQMFVIENDGSLWKITFPLYTHVTDVNQATAVSVYPNPMQHVATLRFTYPLHTPVSLVVYNQLGEVVMQQGPSLDRMLTIKKDKMPTGLYFYQLRTAGAIIYQGKLVSY
ncbi:MAG: hypothetical protein RIQ89_1240 [Bacteroidota bacterium]